MSNQTMSNVHDPRGYGATGNGQTNDTAAIQRAIDACHDDGGGRVVVTPGTYLIGTIRLRSNVELHLSMGATLLASTRREDYTTQWNAPTDRGYKHEKVGAEHLIYARNERNIAITGNGLIDGNARSILGKLDPSTGYLAIPAWRPGQLITLWECSDVLMKDIRITDSPYWTVWPIGCDRVRITGVSILNNRQTPNGDGINPDCCRKVVISDCLLDTGDDCIAVRSDSRRLGDPTRRCEDIVITNCTMRTPCCAIRMGYAGDGPIRRIAASNLVMGECRTGINMLVPALAHEEDALVIKHGPAIEQVNFSNIVMDTRIAFYLWHGDEASRPGGIRDISFSDITATTERACYLGGARNLPLEDIRFRNLRLTVRGETDGKYVDPPYPYPVFDDWKSKGIPHAVYCRHARNLHFNDVQVRWDNATGPWGTPFRFDRVENVRFVNLDAATNRAGGWVSEDTNSYGISGV